MIYLAGALFTKAEQDFGFFVTNVLETLGRKVYYPWRDAGDKELRERFQDNQDKFNREIVKRNLAAIHKCSLFLAIAEGADVDSGTSMELGYAHALGKPIYCLRTDFRTQGNHIGPTNIMLSIPAQKFFLSIEDLKTHLASITEEPPYVVTELAIFYDFVADEYSDPNSHPTTSQCKQTEEIHTKNILKDRAFEVALDIGCGDGNFLMIVNAAQKIGVDFSFGMIQKHKAKLPSARFFTGDCSDLPFKENYAEVIHSAFLFDHLKDITKVLKEIKRILAKDGLFILAFYSPEAMLRIRKNKNDFEYKSRSGKRYIVPSDFNALVGIETALAQHFKILEFTRLPVGIENWSIDYYALEKT